LIPDASVFALMSRVDKVIISTHAIMANGGLVTHSGAYMIALAAQQHSVPVYVVGASYKMTPLYPFDILTYNELLSPEEIFKLSDHDKKENIDVIVPAFDYVPPELVNLYITNLGGQTPKYIYRVFTEFYSQDDIYDLEDDEDEVDGLRVE
jgi:translation initiation factor eIF-2B subunit beta